MPRLVFTPWKEHSQLLAVREYFYPAPSYDGDDMRAKACSIVDVWKLRGNLPHAVESTSLLTDAILHDDASKNSIFSIQATYSAAFCRFVTVLVDSKIQGKKRTMFQRAMDLGLPASFVELRHEATHRELPSLVVLRSAAQRSLDWLWDYYWAKIANSSTQNLVDPAFSALGDDVELRNAATHILRLFGKKEEDVASKRSSKQSKIYFKNALDAVEELSPICQRGYQGTKAISQALVEGGLLIPANGIPENEIESLFSTWDKILKELLEEQPDLLTTLAEYLANTLLAPREVNLKADPYGEAVYMWLNHILTSPSWATPRNQYLSVGYIVATCNENQGNWAGRLRSLMESRPKDADTPSPVETKGMETEEQMQGITFSQKVSVDKANLDALRRFGWDWGAA